MSESAPKLFDSAPAPSGQLKFRVLSGPNMGASLALTSGSYLVGTSAQAELVLQEPSDSPSLVELSLDSELNVSVTLKEGTAKLAGQSLALEQTVPMAAGEILVIGLSALTYLAEGQSIEQLDLSALGLVAPAPAPFAAADTAESALEEVTPETSAPEESATAETQTALTPEPEVAAPAPVAAEKPNRALYLWTALGLILCALALGALVFGSALSNSRAQAQSALAAAQAYLAQPDYQEVSVDLRDHSLYFEGVLPSSASLQAFTAGLPDFPYGVVLNLAVRDRTLVALEQTAAVYGATITARYSQDGAAIELYGYVKDPYVEAGLVTKLSEVLPTEVKLVPRFSYEPRVRALMEQLCPTELNALTFDYADLALYYEGALTLEQEHALEQLATTLGHEIKSQRLMLLPQAQHNANQLTTIELNPQVKHAPPPQSAEPSAPSDPQLGFDPSEIVGVTLQPMRFVSMQDGSKYFEGALLPSGYILKTIALDHLMLQQGSEEFVYGLN